MPARHILPTLLAVASLALTAGCTDPTGSADSPTGPTGPAVPTGPTTDPPQPDLPPQSDVLSLVRVEPDRGLASGLEQVELVGTGFKSGYQVFFGESIAQDTFVLDDRRIVVLTPPRVPGLVDVSVIDPDTGLSAVLEAAYLFFNPVTVTAVDPPAGHILGGEPVTLTGTGFTADSRVVFDGRAAISVDIRDDGNLVAVTPAGTGVGPVSVHVSNQLGVGTLPEGYLYVDAPSIAGVVPRVGPVAGGVGVEVRGQGFHEPVSALIGSNPLQDVELISASVIRGTLPPATSAGSVDVLVSTAFGTATQLDAFTYLDQLSPGDITELLAVTPSSGPAAGGNQVTLVAKGLTSLSDTTVLFAEVEAKVVSVDRDGHSVIVEAPPGAVGPVDITLENGNGAAVASQAYRYEPFIRVYEVSPNFGPAEGGTPITITGEGFSAGAAVRVGALPASDVVVVDATTITAATPPGSPGLANITVLQEGLTDTLVGGFAYQDSMDLWVIDPPQGSQAGGTLISLIGSGFPSDARVKVAGRNATHVTVVSPTLIQAKTPPGLLGTADVNVVSDSRGEVILPLSFTYYDPQSTYGGTWGDGVEGDVNVTVLDSSNGAPIPDAFVMLWTDPDTPYQGFTNQAGQVTFSGNELAGEQMVSASKEGYSSSSVVEYDATNVTLYLNPMSPPSPGEPPAIEPPFYSGRVLNLGKSVPVPFGQCSQKPNAPGTLCDPCVSDASCGESPMRCSELPNQGNFCTQRCTNQGECPAGFGCFPLNGVDDHQCIPTAGEVTAFCDFTNSSIFARDLLPDPGIEANPDLTFRIPIPLGEFAVFCWGGIIDRTTGQFTPYALGVNRHVFALPGDQIEGDIRLETPLNQSYTISLTEVPRGPEGPDINVLFRYLDLGSDGVITFLGQVDSFGDQPFRVDNFPPALTGDLYDASYTFLGGSFALTANFLPYTLTLHQNITKIEDDTMFYLEGGSWTPRLTGVTNNINGLWNMSPGDTIGVGTEGLIIRSVGEAWASQPSGVDVTLNGIHGLADGSAIAVGDDGTAVHYDGFDWNPATLDGFTDMKGVWMQSADHAFAVGFYAVFEFDGDSWRKMSGNTTKNLNGVWGFGGDDVWAVGTFGQVIRYDGSEWVTVTSGTTQSLRAVWGASPDDVYLVGEGGTILHWDGVEMRQVETNTTQTLTAITGTGPDDIIVVGSRGTILHFDGAQWTAQNQASSNNFLAVGGDAGAQVATGGHELLLGPMIAVPENVRPGNGGVMGDSYQISWENQPGTDPHFSFVEVAIPGLMGPIPEWTIVNDWNVQDVLLPDFPSIEGTPGISAGSKILSIFRVYKEGFDIDNYSNQDFNQFRWRSWSVQQVNFTKQ